MSDPSAVSMRRKRLLLGSGALALVVLGALLYRGQSSSGAAGSATETTVPNEPGLLRFEVVDPDGRPVAHAKIAVEAGNACHSEALTDASGHATAPGCLPGPVIARIEAPGLARHVAQIPIEHAAKPVKARLAWAMKLLGQVRDERGQAVPQAQVSVSAPGAGGIEEAWIGITNETGGFSFDTIAGDQVSIEVSAKLHERTVVPNVVLPSAAPLSIVLPRTAAIVGRVRDVQGNPAGDVEVSVAGSGVWPAQRVKSDALGTFRFEPLPEGVYELRAARDSFVSEPLEGLSLDAGQEQRVELKLVAGASLLGRVFDARSGKALPAALVKLAEDALSATPKDTKSLADGGFSLLGLRAVSHRLSVSVPGYVAFEGWVKPSPKALEVGLLRASTLAGSVQDEDGRPVAGVELEVRGQSEIGLPVRIGAAMTAPLMAATPTRGDGASELPASGDNLGVTLGRVPAIPLAGPSPSSMATAGTAMATVPGAALDFRSDDKGAFRLQGLPPGSLRVVARMPGFAASESALIALAAGEVKEGVSVVLSRGGSIAGKLVDSHGAGVEHVRVELVIDGDPEPRSTLSDDSGAFRFEAVRGQCRVTAYPYGLPPVSSGVLKIAPSKEQPVSLVIDGTTHTLEGRVLDSRARPVESATINVQALDARSPFAITALTGPDGRFEIPGLPAPPYRVSADQAELAPSKPMKVTALDRPVEITLAAGSDFEGTVIDGERNEPLAGARVSLAPRGTKNGLSARTKADGSFEFLHVNDGDYSVFIDAEGFIAATRDVTLDGPGQPAQAREETFVLTPSGSASGDVVDRLGAPLWNAEVAAGNPPQWKLATRTDHAGHFVLAGLAPGQQQLSAREKSAGSVALAASVHVYARQETPGVVMRLPGIGGDEPEPNASDEKKAPAKKRHH